MPLPHRDCRVAGGSSQRRTGSVAVPRTECTVRTEPFDVLRRGLSKGRSWFDRLTTNGMNCACAFCYVAIFMLGEAIWSKGPKPLVLAPGRLRSPRWRVQYRTRTIWPRRCREIAPMVFSVSAPFVSIPRTRESIRAPFWIPAFAGMTGRRMTASRRSEEVSPSSAPRRCCVSSLPWRERDRVRGRRLPSPGLSRQGRGGGTPPQ